MMPSGINHARTQVEALSIALLSPSPEEVGRCLPALEEAARSLTGAEKELRSGAADRQELQALRNELRVVNRLIECGAAYYQGWAKLLGAATAGYMPTGEAAPISPRLDGTGSLSLRG